MAQHSVFATVAPAREELGRFAALATRGYRFTKRSPWQVAVGPRGISAPLLHLSPEDLWIGCDHDSVGREGEVVKVELPVGGHHCTLDARVAAVRTAQRRRELGLHLLDVPLAQGREILSFIDDRLADGAARPPKTQTAQREPIRDAAYIREVAEAFAREHATAVIRSGNTPACTLRAVDLQDGELVWQTDELPEELLEGGAPFMLEGRSLNSVFWLPVLEAQAEDDLLRFRLPPEIMRVRNRWRRRVPAPQGARVRFLHPLWPERIVSRPLRDLSYTGLGFVTEAAEDLVYPGMQIPLIEIVHGDEPPIRVSGEVRAISTRPDRERVCGLQLDVPPGPTSKRWLAMVNKVLHPRTSTRASYSAQSWELFAASGYFKLSGKDESQFVDLRDKFVDVGQKLDDAEHVGFRAVWPSSRGVEASLSFIKPYATSWLGHQMAKRPGAPSGLRSRQVLRDIYMRTYEPVQNDPSLRWLVGYCEDNVPWMKVAHTDFALRYEHEGKGCAYEFQLMEVPCADVPAALPGDEYTVGPATADECQRLLDWIARERPAAYRESLDLVPERFALTETREKWRQADMELCREVLVVRRDGQACAAVILESAEEGTNLFHLLDSARVFPLRRRYTRGQAQDDAYRPLFRAAARWFADRGRSRFVYFLEGDAPSCVHNGQLSNYVTELGMKDLGPGRFWVLSAELLPDFLEHIHRLTAPKKVYSPGRRLTGPVPCVQ